MEEKRIFWRNTDREPGFKYNIEKAQMKKGSVISKNIHPLLQVEVFKNNLLSCGKMIDIGDKFVLRRTINTGWHMAKNLHYGQLINEKSSLWKKSGYLSFRKNDTFDEVIIDDITSSCCNLTKASFMDELKIDYICKAKLNYGILNEHNGDKFSRVERLFHDELVDKGILTRYARHGETSLRECDIVDEFKKIQIEVVTEFKSLLHNNKAPQADYDGIGLESTHGILVRTSDALLDKLYKKEYTDKYDKYLAIYTLGDTKSVIRMAEVLLDNIRKRGKVKNNFKDIFVIWNDFVNDKTFIYYNDGSDNRVDEIMDGVEILEKNTYMNYSDLCSYKKDIPCFWKATSIFDDSYGVAGILPISEIIKNVIMLRIITS